jgi:4-amino-4-deoxy-L-arabinose transferase-like glycosyltransferase
MKRWNQIDLRTFDNLPVHLLLLTIVSATVFFTNLGEAQLWDRDEPRNAGCAAEMMARGDWVVPMFNDELRQQKPVLVYWLIMSAYWSFVQNEFAARYWSAILGIGTVLVTYGIARRMAGSTVAIIAGLMLASSVMFDVAARAATPDSALVFCSTMAMYIYVVGTFARRGNLNEPLELKHAGQWFPQNYLTVVGIYAMLGLGVLAKGPVGFVLPMAIIGMFLLIQRLPAWEHPPSNRVLRFLQTCCRPFYPLHFLRTLWSMRPFSAAAIILLVAGPWYVMVHLRTDGDFTRLFLLHENFGRATMAMESHSGGIWYYPLALLFGFFPWSIFVTPVAATLFFGGRSGRKLSPLEVFAICSVLVQVCAFSIAKTKLPSYITPCYPALALLTAYCLVDWVRQEAVISKWWYYIGLSGFITGGVMTAIGLGVAVYLFLPEQVLLPALGIIPVIGGSIAIWQLIQNQKNRVMWTSVCTSLLFCFVMFGFGTVAVDTHQQHQLVLNKVAEANEGQFVAAYRSLESSWVYYSAKPIYECSVDESVADPGLDRKRPWNKKPRATPETILATQPNAMFITTDEHLDELKERLPDDFEVVQSTDYFLSQKKIMLLKRAESRVAQAVEETTLK